MAAEARKRRIVRLLTWTVTGVVLLLTSYVSAWLMLPTAQYKGIVRGNADELAEVLFSPICDYVRSNLPGTDSLMRWRERLNEDAYEAWGFYGNTRTPLPRWMEWPRSVPNPFVVEQLRRQLEDELKTTSRSQQPSDPTSNPASQ